MEQEGPWTGSIKAVPTFLTLSDGQVSSPQSHRKSFKQWLYFLSNIILIVFIIGFMVVSPIDIITQSQQTNQFWNGAIVIAGCVIFICLALLLSFLRLFRTRKNLSDIPRRYVPRPDDLPESAAREIQNELNRCKQILRNTKPVEKVTHDGLAPPDSSGDIPPDVPYKDVVDTAALLIDARARNIHFSFGKPIGMALREYILHLISCHVITDANVGIHFLELYERLRFSGKPISASEIRTFIERLMRLMEHFDFPPDDLYKHARSTIGNKSSASMGPTVNYLSDDLAAVTTWSSNVNSDSPGIYRSFSRSDAEYALNQQSSRSQTGHQVNLPYQFLSGGDHPNIQHENGPFDNSISRFATSSSRVSRFSNVGSVIGPGDRYSSEESYAGSVIIRRE